MINNNLYIIEELNFSYKLGEQDIRAINDLSCHIPAEILVTLSGPSGSGKSTLLNLLGLIEPMQYGKILFLNEDIQNMNDNLKNDIRKYKIGFIFQDFHLMPVLTAEENVSYFLKHQDITSGEVENRAREALEAVGLWEHRNKKPGELSGGQKQRVAIARAFAKNPQVIIADEPTASLDQKTGKDIMKIIMELIKEKKVSVVLTTHDPMIRSFSEIDFHMQDGKLI